jgi:hypothetical protein
LPPSLPAPCPAGTGKTLIARACAAQTNATFLKLAGTSLVQMFIGDGAKMVRDAFALAKEKQPCIIFIDEIDSIGEPAPAARLVGWLAGAGRLGCDLIAWLAGSDWLGAEPKSQWEIGRASLWAGQTARWSFAHPCVLAFFPLPPSHLPPPHSTPCPPALQAPRGATAR